MTAITATVFHNGKDWDVNPAKIVLDATNPAVDHWDLTDVYARWGTKVHEVRIEFTGGPPPPASWTRSEGPLTTRPSHRGPRLDGAGRNAVYGLYSYNVIVTLSGDLQNGFRLLPIDPQIDNAAKPGPPGGITGPGGCRP